jgi:hypothetical protein
MDLDTVFLGTMTDPRFDGGGSGAAEAVDPGRRRVEPSGTELSGP